MKKLLPFSLLLLLLIGCEKNEDKMDLTQSDLKKDNFQYQTEQFADLAILRYQVPGFEELSLKEKELVYYLYEAALCGQRYLLRSKLSAIIY